MIFVPSLPMSAYYSDAFGNRGHPPRRLLRGAAATELTFMYSVCFIRAAIFGVSHLFLPSRFRASRDEGCLWANEGDLIPLSREMKANILDISLLKIISDSEVGPVGALLVFV